MESRTLEKHLRETLARSPAVALIGPRQAGKTTLAKAVGGAYFDLEQESERLRLDVEWDRVVDSSQAQAPVVLDEAQSWPELFPRLRGAIDARRREYGRFLLLGSVSPALMRNVSESLAGRLALLELTPFLYEEIPGVSLDEQWLRGGFPDGILEALSFPRWHNDYVALLTQRDLPNWGLSAAPQVTQRLVRMLAAVHGQLWNASQLAASLGVSAPTLNRYLDYLDGAFLIRRLQPFSANLKKRLVKRPKVFWRDCGLLHALLQTSTRDELLTRPWVGASWEGFAIEQVLGLLEAKGEPFQSHFFRTSDGYEIDLLVERRGELEAIEIKLTTNPSPEDLARLDKSAALVGARRRVLISRAEGSATERDRISCSLPQYLEWLSAL